MSPETPDLHEVLATLEAATNRRKFRRMDFFIPYSKQQAFFDLGLTHRERLLMAGNQQGKSYAGAYETACHLTGLYPDWWYGRRWERPVKGWAAGETAQVVRDVQQRLLCGQPGVDSMFGTGMIPKDNFTDKPSLARGVADAFDTVQVMHASGGISTLHFKSYEQGRTKFQGESVDFLWWDEEPDEDIYAEGLTRTVATGGMSFMTFTPLKGLSGVVRRFIDEVSVDRGIVNMTIDDALHISAEERARVVAAYLPHEREARTFGTPMLGEGKVFTTPTETICEPLLEGVPLHWAKLWGVDFGIDHPFAASLIAWDKDADIIHVLHTIRMTGGTPLQHAVPMKLVGASIPVAWPHDGTSRDKGSGEALSVLYRKQQLPMLPDHATWPEGGVSFEAGIMEMQDRFATGRLKVASHLSEFLDEYRSYHRSKGLVVKKHDDILSSVRVALMAKRFAKALPLGNKARRKSGTYIAAGIDFDLS